MEPESPKEVPFRKTVKRPYNSSGPLSDDHDYLANLPGTKNPRKNTSASEDKIQKICEETLKILHNINTNVNLVAEKIDNLTQEIKSCGATLNFVLNK